MLHESLRVRCLSIIAGCMHLFHIIMLHSMLRATETGLSIYPLWALVFRSHTPQNGAFVCHATSVRDGRLLSLVSGPCRRFVRGLAVSRLPCHVLGTMESHLR